MYKLNYVARLSKAKDLKAVFTWKLNSTVRLLVTYLFLLHVIPVTSFS